MTYSARIYAGPMFCVVLTGHDSQELAAEAAGAKLAERPDYYTHADIAQDGVVRATIYPLIKE